MLSILERNKNFTHTNLLHFEDEPMPLPQQVPDFIENNDKIKEKSRIEYGASKHFISKGNLIQRTDIYNLVIFRL